MPDWIGHARYNSVTHGYAEAIGLCLHEGRLLAATDASAFLGPLLVNDAFVRSYVRDGRTAVGRQMKGAFSDEETVSAIVGVVGDEVETE